MSTWRTDHGPRRNIRITFANLLRSCPGSQQQYLSRRNNRSGEFPRKSRRKTLSARIRAKARASRTIARSSSFDSFITFPNRLNGCGSVSRKKWKTLPDSDSKCEMYAIRFQIANVNVIRRWKFRKVADGKWISFLYFLTFSFRKNTKSVKQILHE